MLAGKKLGVKTGEDPLLLLPLPPDPEKGLQLLVPLPDDPEKGLPLVFLETNKLCRKFFIILRSMSMLKSIWEIYQRYYVVSALDESSD